MTRLSAMLPALLLTVLVGGCFPRPDYRDLPDTSVIQRNVTVLETVVVTDNAAPTAPEQSAIAAALAQGGESGLRVRVRLPQGAPVPAAAEMRRRIQAMGIDPAIAMVEPNAATAAGTDLVFVRITIAAPDCDALVTPSEAISAGSRPSMAFGCATYSNLTHMVADPADLVAPRRFGGPDGTTSATAVDRYHQDKVTPLRRTTSVGSLNSAGSQ